MEIPSKTLRQDVIQNAVNHQIQELEDTVASPAALNTLFGSELRNDLITWPRQYLEAYLDSDESGRVPLTPEQLQDILEAAFERDEALAVEFLEEVRANKGPQTLPDSSIQIADARAADSEHPYELLFDRTNTADFTELMSRIHALAKRGQPQVERRETTSLVVEHKAGSGIIAIDDKLAGTDVRKLLGGAALPHHVRVALNELGSDARIEQALTDSGAYRGTILAETARDLIQQISPHSVVIHRKDHLDAPPQTGEHVRVVYVDGVGHVQQVRDRSHRKELSR
jgi:hypothetical protein